MDIGGNVVLPVDASGEIRNAYIERIDQAREDQLTLSLNAAHLGRLIFNRLDGNLKVWTGSTWRTLAGGQSGDIEEVENMIAAFGFLLNDGNFDSSVFDAFNLSLSNATTLLGVLEVIDNTIQELRDNQRLANMADVSVSGANVGDALVFDNGVWQPKALLSTDLFDVTVNAEELNCLTGLTDPIKPVLDDLTNRVIVDDDYVFSAEQSVAASFSIFKQDRTANLVGTVEFTYQAQTPFTLGTIDSSVLPLYDGVWACAAKSQTGWIGSVMIQIDNSGTMTVYGVPGDVLIENSEIITVHLANISYFVAAQ